MARAFNPGSDSTGSHESLPHHCLWGLTFPRERLRAGVRFSNLILIHKTIQSYCSAESWSIRSQNPSKSQFTLEGTCYLTCGYHISQGRDLYWLNTGTDARLRHPNQQLSQGLASVPSHFSSWHSGILSSSIYKVTSGVSRKQILAYCIYLQPKGNQDKQMIRSLTPGMLKDLSSISFFTEIYLPRGPSLQ